VTGSRDLSQIGASDALTQAFSQQATTGFASESGAGYSHAPIERILLGPFDLKSVLLMNVVNDDNLDAGETGQGQGQQGKVSDTSFGLTPAILLQYGTHEGQRGNASLVYSPTFTRYIHQSQQDSDNQNVAFSAQYPLNRLTLDLAQTYAETTGYNQDQNERTTQTSIISTFGGSYDIDDKLSLAVHAQHLITSFSGVGSSGGTGSSQSQGQGDAISSINTTLSYHYSDKLTFGPSFNAGVDKPEGEKQETFEQGFVGATYLPTEKISFFSQAGVEFRQGIQNDLGGSGNQGGSNGSEMDPIFSAGVGYTPFDSTSLSLSASQSVHSSSAQGQGTVESTGVGISATQRFFQRLFLNLAINYSHQNNQQSSFNASTGTGGEEDTLTYRPSLSISPTAWSSVALYYQYLDNESNDQGQSYHDNQMGLAVSVQF